MPAKLVYVSDPVADPALLPHWLTLGRLTLPGKPQNVRHARRFVADIIGETHRQCDTALLLTSELVTNAVAHSRSGLPGGTLDVIVSATCSALLITVTDNGSEAGPPAIRTPPGGTDGNGLVLVDSLSDGWGYRHERGRTAVWFRLRALGAPTPDALPELAPPGAALTATARSWSLVPHTHGELHGRAVETELLTQPALDEPAIAGLQEARGEQHDVRRANAHLGGEHHLRLSSASHRRRRRGDERRQPGVEPAGRDPGLPPCQRLVQRGHEPVDMPSGHGRDVHPGGPPGRVELPVDLAIKMVPAVLVD